jgi:hypothetical protein
MCIPPQAIRACLDDPAIKADQPGQHGRMAAFRGRQRQIYSRDGLHLVVDPGDKVVITAYVKREEFARDDLTYIWQGGGWVDY